VSAPDSASAPTEYRQFRFVRPPGSTSILLIRHGESVPARADAPFSLVGGQGDPELDPVGIEQAERVGERLRRLRHGDKVSAIYVTTLRRTAETAAPLVEALGVEPVVEPDLREVHLGEWEGGLYRIKLAEGGPIAKQLMDEGRWGVIPGAEPDEQFASRVKAAVQRIAGAHPDELVAVFTHGGVIAQVMAHSTGGRPFAFAGVANGSISEIVVLKDRWVIRSFNDTGHLEEMNLQEA
jgi:probable phosphoglycerate mutase